MNDSIDFARDAAPEATTDTLAAITYKIAELDHARAVLAQLDEQRARVQATLDSLEQVIIPDLMATVGMSSFKLTDGRSVSVAEEVYCGISEANAPEAYAWLRAQGHDSIIKHIVGVEFGKGTDAEATRLATELVDRFGDRLKVADKETIHPSTLRAFVREALREGLPLPEQTFGVRRFNRTIIKEPRT